jgi:hypothetical protein
MFAPYMKNLRVKLQERKDAVMRAKPHYVESHLKTFLNFLSTQSALVSITTELEGRLAAEEKKQLINQLNVSQPVAFRLPDDESRRAAYLLIISRYVVDSHYAGSFLQKMASVFRHRTYQEDLDEFSEQLVLPLYHYYDERIDDADLLLYLLLKYKRLSEWFDREKLFYLSNQDPGKREQNLDSHLRKFLMQEGIDYPFSTPHSPKGRADIVVHEEEKPIPLEIKIFDSDSYSKSYIKKGLAQALQYAEDYHQSFGYLVIFNLSDKLLQIGSKPSEDYFPKIETQNKVIFVVPINIHPIIATASQEKEVKLVVVDEEYLLGAD